MSNQSGEKEVFEPVTLGDLADKGLNLTAHCRDCGHWERLKPDQLGLPLSRSIPSLERAFVCSVCKSKNTCAMPEYIRPKVM